MMSNLSKMTVVFISSLYAASTFAGIPEYKEKLSQIAPENLSQMRSEAWRDLIPLIDQDVLDDAHSKNKELMAMFGENSVTLIPRRAKTMERIGIKRQKPQADIAYKVNSDFSALLLS